MDKGRIQSPVILNAVMVAVAFCFVAGLLLFAGLCAYGTKSRGKATAIRVKLRHLMDWSCGDIYRRVSPHGGHAGGVIL
jgi:hypothetical protein